MAQSKTAEDYRRWNQDISGSLRFTAATDDTTLFAARNANSTLYIQRIVVYITTDAAQSLSFEDSAGSPLPAAKVPTSPGVDTRWEFFFGDRGVPLTEGKDFRLNVSAVGLAGHVEWEGYTRLTTAMAPGTTN